MDRRKSVRKRAGYILCWTPESGAILNVSSGGMAIETCVDLELDQKILVKLRPRGEKITVSGRVRWVQEIASVKIGSRLSPVRHAGLQLDEAACSIEWQQFLDALPTGQGGSSFDGRKARGALSGREAADPNIGPSSQSLRPAS